MFRTINLISRPLRIDRLELAYRFGKNELTTLGIVHDVASIYLERKLAEEVHGLRPYPNCKDRLQISIPLSARPRLTLFVETGIAIGKGGILLPYAKFVFNVQRLLRSSVARAEFHRVMDDFMPGGGYSQLCEEGYVLYAEFAADFTGRHMADYDAYSKNMKNGDWICPAEEIETINLDDGGKGYREYAFTIYQKSKQEREVYHHIRRVESLRAEAKRRFNRTPTYRKIRLAELPRIINPFATLGIYERARIPDTFKAARDRHFLEVARRFGLQSAFQGTRGADRERREKKLARCHVNWWNPEQVWSGIDQAVLSALQI